MWFRKALVLCFATLAACASEDRSTDAFKEAGYCVGRCIESSSGTTNNAVTGTAGTGTSTAGTGSAAAGTTSSDGPGDIGIGEAGAMAAADGGMGEGAPDNADAGPQGLGGGPCPMGFVCFADPLVGMLHACLKGGGPLPLPVECMTDADCIMGGLPKGTCVSEEETDLNGCMQLCTPEPDAGM
jgi:hypothetical protein